MPKFESAPSALARKKKARRRRVRIIHAAVIARRARLRSPAARGKIADGGEDDPDRHDHDGGEPDFQIALGKFDLRSDRSKLRPQIGPDDRNVGFRGKFLARGPGEGFSRRLGLA